MTPELVVGGVLLAGLVIMLAYRVVSRWSRDRERAMARWAAEERPQS